MKHTFPRYFLIVSMLLIPANSPAFLGGETFKTLSYFVAGHGTNLGARQVGRWIAQLVGIERQPEKAVTVIDSKHFVNGEAKTDLWDPMLARAGLPTVTVPKTSVSVPTPEAVSYDAGNGFLSLWEMLCFLQDAYRTLPITAADVTSDLNNEAQLIHSKVTTPITQESPTKWASSPFDALALSTLAHFAIPWAVCWAARHVGDAFAHRTGAVRFPANKMLSTALGATMGYLFKTQLWDRYAQPVLVGPDNAAAPFYNNVYKVGDKMPFAVDALKKIIPLMVKFPAFAAIIVPAIAISLKIFNEQPQAQNQNAPKPA